MSRYSGRILLLAASIVFLLFLSGALYQAVGARADRRRFPPPGRLLDIGGPRLHLLDLGNGNPSVVLEAGLSASCLNWTRVQTELARFTRVMSYDRASLGWSDATTKPRTILNLVDDLHALLDAARVPAPFVLAGHSFGAMLARSYAIQYPDRVAGLVLIDPLGAADWLHPKEMQTRMLRRGVRLSRRGAMLARWGVVRLCLAMLSGGLRRIPKLVAGVSSGRGETVVSRMVGEVRKMPRETWPMVQAHWSLPKNFLGMADYLESLPESSGQAAALGELAPDIPVVILSAGNSTPSQLADRDAIAKCSTAGKHVVVAESGHWIHLDQPELVIHVIRELLESLQFSR